MTDRSKPRKPATFRLDDANVVVVDGGEADRPARGTVRITPEPEPQLPVPIEAPAPPRRGFGWGTLFWSAVAGLVLLGLGLGTVNLIEDLFARSEGLGVLGIALTSAAALALGVITLRELTALVRLATIEKLHVRASAVLLSDDRDESRAVLRDLLKLAHQNPQLAAPAMRWHRTPRTSSTAPT
jgi:putative membrane protein